GRGTWWRPRSSDARSGGSEGVTASSLGPGKGAAIVESELRLPPLTHEDTDRSADRARVHRARQQDRRWYLIWLLIGPGILAMLGENDGPSMIAYAADGAQYGLRFFVALIPVLCAMAYVCQEMCMRVGAVTHRGYGELVLQRYGALWGWFAAADLT